MNIRGLFCAVSAAAVLGMSAFAGGAMADVAPGLQPRVDTVQEHEAEDNVVHDSATEQRLQAQTRRVTAVYARAAAAAASGTPDQVGQWGPVVDWPVVAVHVALLSNGLVLAYDSVGDQAVTAYPDQTFTRATLFDPVTGTQTAAWFDGYNIFCSGLAHLPDGRVFIAGGNKDQNQDGIVQTTLFDPETSSWSLGPDMAAPRWYPSVTPLRNGEMLITSGGPLTPEVRRIDGTLRALSSAPLPEPLYPWFDLAPDGRAFYSGPDQTLRLLDTSGTGSWETLTERDSINRTYGGHVLYDIGKVLVAGGGESTSSAEVIDINGATPTVTAVAPMAYGRRQHNLTVLADGTVLATGGNSSGASTVDLNAGVYPAERWDPATGQWTTLAAMQVTRQYHSTALLLPDGRVLSAGGGVCGTCDDVGYLAKNAEIFSPPYLFARDGSGQLAPRPTITTAPASLGYAAGFDISTPDAATVAKVSLVRLGAVTHSNNMEQRYVPLQFTAGAGTLRVTSPASASIAPPGPYMLFIINTDGVPSLASMVSLTVPLDDDQTAPTVKLTAPANPADLTGTATVSWSASDPTITGAIRSGVWNYDARYRTATAGRPFGSYSYPPSWQRTSKTSAVIIVAPATQYCASVRARDLAGNESSWTSERCTTTPLDDRYLTTRAARLTGTAYYRTTYSRAAATGTTFTRTGITAKGIAIVATTCTSCGTVDVNLAGKDLGHISLRASTTRYRQVIWLAAFPTRTGTLTVRTLNNSQTLLDAVITTR